MHLFLLLNFLHRHFLLFQPLREADQCNCQVISQHHHQLELSQLFRRKITVTGNMSALASPVLTTRQHFLPHYRSNCKALHSHYMSNLPSVRSEENGEEFVLVIPDRNVYLVVTLAIDLTHSLWLSGSSVPNR